MKKRIITLTLILSVFFAFMFGIKALETAKAPSESPEPGTIMYGATDGTLAESGEADHFDFSKVSFKSGNDSYPAKDWMEKIKISTNYKIDDETGKIHLTDNWFTAYCLDPNVHYPIHGISAMSNIANVLAAAGSGDIDKEIFDEVIIAALLNAGLDSSKSDGYNAEYYELLKKLKGEGDYRVTYTLPDGYNTSDPTVYRTLLTKILSYKATNGDPEIKVGVTEFALNPDGGNNHITGADINSAFGITGAGNVYSLKLSNENIHFDKYVTANMESNAENNHVLWIIEHSYPSIELDKLFKAAGVIGSNLRTEVLSLGGNDALTDDEKVENYVYSTIQYAIWHALDKKITNHPIGNELVSTDASDSDKVVELNKLYQYLIKDRDEYNDYNATNNTFGKTLKINKPGSKEIKEESSDSTIQYGPYTVTSDMVTAGDISLSVKGNVNGIKIVNASMTAISSIKEGEEFYVLVDKKIKYSSDRIYIVAKTSEGITYESNRGRIYHSVNPLTQNVASGGKVEVVTAQDEYKITMNVHTGLINIASLFIMTLIVFSLGYLLLSYTNKKVEL